MAGSIAVFGSAGERDTAKRPQMGRIAGERARIVVVTDEDPRGEDRQAILDEIARGAEAAGRRRDHDLLVIADRRAAIEAAFERARPGDIVLLAGKGHEQAIIGPDGPQPWDERAEAEAALRRAGLRLRVSLIRWPTTTPAHRRRPRARRPPGAGRVERRPLAAEDGARRRSISTPCGPTSTRPSSRSTPAADLGPVGEAFDLAVTAHEGQRRATGEPYVTHPIASAQILAELGIDTIAIQAALLHDVPEDTEYSLTDVEERFGAEVAQLVDGVTKLSKFSTHSHEQQQAENIRKMLLAMAQDIRVVLIKLADRLHNMRTLYGLPSEKQQRIARQTMEIYAPLAERLGIWQMKWELEDLAFKVLEPERFRELAKLLDTRRKGRETLHRSGHRRAQAQARGGRHRGRPPGPPEAHLQHLEEDAAQERGVRRDLRRLRHPHPRRRGPRLLRGARHRPLDLAADPGPVRRLHRGPQEQPLPVAPHRGHRARRQAARDPDPDPRDAPGVARSASPPTGATRKAPSPTASTTPSWPGCASSWTGSATSSDATEFVEGIKLDIFQDQVFVFTPKGDIKDLPAGATPLDFAYRIHTDVGHRTIGAKVNNRLVPLDYRLKNGDIVEIVTTKGEHGPSRDWMNDRPDQPRPREDPPMVQAQGPRREHRPRA